MVESLARNLDPPQHTGDLLHSLLLWKLLDLNIGSPARFLFSHFVVRIGKGGDLGEVSNTKNLVLPGNFFQLSSYDFGDSPPMPASTSSKMRVLTRASSAKIRFMASMILESSPPEAIFARGFRSSPGLGEMRN